MSADVSGFEALSAVFLAMKARAEDLSPVMDEVGAKLRDSAQDAMEARRSPQGTSWEPRAPSTRAIKGGQISGRLEASLAFDISSAGAEVTSNLPYASVQNYGNPRNKLFGGTVKPIPARPFSPVNESGELPPTLQTQIGEMIMGFIVQDGSQ